MRNQEIWKQFEKEILNRREETRLTLNKIYKSNGEEFRKGFQKSLTEALRKFEKRQESDKSIKVKYIYVHSLRTELETQTYQYIIRIMDERQYGDGCAAEVYYVPRYIKEYIDADREYFSKLIMSRVIRAKKYEVKDFLRKYLWETYIKPIPSEIYDILENIETLEAYTDASRSDEVIAGYGEILERPFYYWKFKGEVL